MRSRQATAPGPRRSGRGLVPVLLWLAIGAGVAVFLKSRDLLHWPFREPMLDPALGGLDVIPRRRWQAATPREASTPLGKPTRITIHHEGGKVFLELNRRATARMIRNIQRYHQEENGWGDIGYHFIVDRGGRIWEGRSLDRRGAHAGTDALNQANIGVLVLGNFELQAPSGSQLAGLRRLIETLCRAKGIPRRLVQGHREVRLGAGLGTTQCPGRNLEGWIREFRGG